MTRAKKIRPAGRIVDTAKLADDPAAATLRVWDEAIFKSFLGLFSKKEQQESPSFLKKRSKKLLIVKDTGDLR